MAESVKTGDQAEATELGQVVGKLLDFFEQMDLPASLDGMRIIITADTESEGVCAGSEGYQADAKTVAADLMQHASVLLSTLGIGMDIVSAEELVQMMGAEGTT